MLMAIVLGLGFMVYQQVGLDSRTVRVVDVNTNEVQEFQIISVLPRDAIPAITNPKFVSVAEAGPWMKPNEQVIGLAINGEVKAYAINQLSRHEIVDDVVGGVPVAVTW